jgi:hypothetical protein
MTHKPPAPVKLTKTEKALADKIEFDALRLDRNVARENGEMALKLTNSLHKRGVVPEVRVRYFVDPVFNIGVARSREEVFHQNGTSGDAVMRHPHFLPYLRYFIHGPDLPGSTITGFCKIVNDDLGTTGMLLKQLRQFAQSEVRQHRLDKSHAADEFFKLSHELGLDDHFCRTVRDAAKQTR